MIVSHDVCRSESVESQSVNREQRWNEGGLKEEQQEMNSVTKQGVKDREILQYTDGHTADHTLPVSSPYMRPGGGASLIY